jgi:hypothetical protein
MYASLSFVSVLVHNGSVVVVVLGFSPGVVTDGRMTGFL